MVMIEVPIPKSGNYLAKYSAFQWTLTILDNPMQRRRLQFSSSNIYEEIGYIEVNGYAYEKLIFDFKKGRLKILIRQSDPKAVHNILNALTIHTSPTSQLYYLNKRRNKPDGTVKE
ncbi:hypothetical protein [Lysinibacillus antri]|uniref:Uncharacterized protein n=1 Tax=Lysinibacillus antri TaxID=2498145 RepID=A0A432LCX9_9BACI|nr:hypothetical protein [Lysinibacillus antri]RUL53196.1 hypothetical protein EK386_09545 [Lysinibacillus antri]